MTNKRLATKSTPNQPNVIETQFACLEALVTNMASDMVAHVKPIIPTSSDSSTQGFDPRFFCGVRFSWPLSPNEIKLDILDDHVSRVAGDKTLVRVSPIAPITKANA